MKYIAMEHEVADATAEDFQPHLKAEAAHLWHLYQEGVVRESYFRADQHTAVLMLECEDEAAVCEALDSLPLVRAGLISFEIIPLMPYSGFARLFEENKPF